MIWFWGVLAVVLLTPLLILIPRVIFRGKIAPGNILLEFIGVGFRIAYTGFDGVSGSFLFWRFDGVESAAGDPLKRKDTGAPQAIPAPQPARRRVFRPPADLILILIKRLFRLLKRLFGSIHADQIRLKAIVATPDPMWTGTLFGALQPIRAFHNPPKREFDFEIDFTRESPLVFAEWSFSSRPIVWVWIFLSWGAALPWRRIWSVYRASRKDAGGRGC